MEARTQLKDFRGGGGSSVPREETCMHEQKVLHRRAFLGLGAAAAASALVPSKARAATAAASPAGKAPERVLSFFNTHTGERLKTTYCSGGSYVPDSLRDLNI